jgi:hypothetical protein
VQARRCPEDASLFSRRRARMGRQLTSWALCRFRAALSRRRNTFNFDPRHGSVRSSICRSSAVLLAAALLSNGCSGRSLSTDEAGPQRPEAECMAVRANTASDQDLQGASPPVLRAVRLPPETPPSLRGRTLHVHVVVSETGRVVPGSVSVEGSEEPGYNQRVARAAEQWTFRPARFDGCTIAQPFTWTLKAPS